MGYWTILILAVSLAMDAFAVAVADGVALGGKRGVKAALAIAASFGLAQGLMPLAGFFAGALIGGEVLRDWSRWVAFILLAVIGGKMIYETLRGDGDESAPFALTARLLLAQAVATSIDALAVGVAFAAEGVNIYAAAPLIAAVTFIIVLIGALGGGKLGGKLEKRAGLAGGAALVLIGFKTLLF